MWEFKGCVENGVMNKFHSRHQTGEEEDGVNIFTFDRPTFEDINHVDLCYWLRVFGQGD